jgi:hypothetical protein
VREQEGDGHCADVVVGGREELATCGWGGIGERKEERGERLFIFIFSQMNLRPLWGLRCMDQKKVYNTLVERDDNETRGCRAFRKTFRLERGPFALTTRK